MKRLITYESDRCTGQFPKFSMTKYSVNENLSGRKFLMLGKPQKIREIRKKKKKEEPIKVKERINLVIIDLLVLIFFFSTRPYNSPSITISPFRTDGAIRI
jgi:hypothetical protein